MSQYSAYSFALSAFCTLILRGLPIAGASITSVTQTEGVRSA
jgi:hypothetical protein